MKVSGREVAEAILKKLESEIKQNNLKPSLAIILAGHDPSSKIYVANKIKIAKRVGIKAELFEFSEEELEKCLQKLDELNLNKNVHGIIIQHPTYPSWDYEQLLKKLDPKKDVDGFLPDSPFLGAAALAVWEMLTAYAYLEGFKRTEDFLRDKKIIVVGKGKTAGGPTVELLEDRGFQVTSVVKETKNPTAIIKSADIVISATGVKNIINKNNLKKGAYVVSVGLGKEIIDGKEKVYGDINEEDASKIAKLYCPTIGGIGPLTIVSLLKNVVKSTSDAQSHSERDPSSLRSSG